MIDRSISTSRKLSKVDDRTALIFTWLQPHTDSFGRMDGDAELVLATVVPLRKYDVEEVEESLAKLQEVGLIELYKIEEDTYLEIVGFDDHQTFKPSRVRVGQFPDRTGKIPRLEPYQEPNDEQVSDSRRTRGGQTSDSVRVSKVKLSKVKTSKVKKKAVAPVGKPYGEFQNVFLEDDKYERLRDYWLAGNEPALQELIFELSAYMAQSDKNRKKYTDHYATLLAWAKRKFGESKIKENAKKKDIVGLDDD